MARPTRPLNKAHSDVLNSIQWNSRLLHFTFYAAGYTKNVPTAFYAANEAGLNEALYVWSGSHLTKVAVLYYVDVHGS